MARENLVRCDGCGRMVKKERSALDRASAIRLCVKCSPRLNGK